MSSENGITDEMEQRIDNDDHIDDRNKDILKGLVGNGLGFTNLGSYASIQSAPRSAHEINRFINDYKLRKYSDEAVVWGITKGIEFNVNESETKALCWLADKGQVDLETVKRRQSPDFVYHDNVGLEVKSNQSYSLSRAQVRAASNLSMFYVVLSNERYCKVLDTIDWLGFNELDDMTVLHEPQ